jgi:hypothetical protein
MKALEFDEAFESGSDILEYLDVLAAERPNQEIKRVNVDFPKWMVESLDREARKLGVTRQSIIKVWLAQRIETAAK